MTDLTTIITALAAKYGPASVDLAMSAIRVNGIASLVQGFAFGCVAVAVGFVIRWLMSEWHKDDEEHFGLFVFVLALSMGALVAAIISIAELFDMWNWVAIFSPETYAAAKVLRL